MARSQTSNREQTAPWIYTPWLDLIVGCGAWSAPLLLISYSTVASSARTWSLVFYGLAFLFNYPHYMATIYRAYHRTEDFEKYRVFTVHITALVVLTLFLSHFWIRLLPWIFTIYLTWSPWHYSGQNYGLMMMFARRAGANPDKGTRRVLYGAFVVSYLILFLAFHTGASTDPLFLSLGIPAAVSRWEQITLVVWFVILSGVGLSRLARETGWRKLIPSLTLFSSQFLWFLLPAAMTLLRRLELPQNRYSTGVLAVMHSAQYLWITSYYARREAAGEGQGETKLGRSWRPLAYFGVLIVGGIALFVPGPWLASRAFHHDFSTSFLIFTSLVNIHHFILDGAIWKLRDGRIAALLLNSRERVAGAVADAGGRLASTLRWMAGGSAGARRLQVGAVLLILVWGTVDQAWHYLALRSDDLHDLQRAAAIDSYDSPLQMRLARKELEAGNAQQAEVAWKRALQANPADPAPRQALLKFLLDQKRYDEAFSLTEASLKYAPKDANLLVDRGLLALQRGHADEALANWNQALAVDPDQALAHLYLAHELDREGKAQTAAAHYKSFLDRVAQLRAQDRPAPDAVIGIILRMADCQARSSQTDVAIKSYEMAETLAAQTGQAKLESVAAVNEAALQAKSGKLDDALRLYQHTLQIDTAAGDTSASAVDWFAYGRFLEESGFPDRLVYACMVRSEQVAQALPKPPLPASVAAARLQIEKRMGASATAVRRDPEPVLQEALKLRR
ncbi:MAG TPA: tetratricopeptide repeat protein [Candidatus Dormibacteraeota bacterium]|nr:tetratricopeptide repeat protein [Candidatus Dormibacteraeota bacterium]